MAKPTLVCPNCGTQFRKPKNVQRGSFLVLLLLLCLFVVPGVIYLLWMLGATEQVCPSCDSTEYVKIKTPRGQKLVAEYGTE